MTRRSRPYPEPVFECPDCGHGQYLWVASRGSHTRLECERCGCTYTVPTEQFREVDPDA
jgi:transcription elongation factor Elf1